MILKTRHSEFNEDSYKIIRRKLLRITRLLQCHI